MQSAKKRSIVLSALTARTGFGKLLRRVEDEQRSLVIEKRGTPAGVLLSIRDYVRLAAPEPECFASLVKNQSGRARTSLAHAGSTRLSRWPALENASADDLAPAGSRYQHHRLSRPQADGLQRTVLLLAITKPTRYMSLRRLLRSTVTCSRAPS